VGAEDVGAEVDVVVGTEDVVAEVDVDVGAEMENWLMSGSSSSRM